jgi:hypothetical protein
VWICETGSKEAQEEDDWLFPKESAPVDPNNSKGTWIRQMLASTAFPRVRGVVWFNHRKGRDWPLTSSDDSLSAIQAYLAGASRGRSTAAPVGNITESTMFLPPHTR